MVLRVASRQRAGTPQQEVWLCPHHTELWKGCNFCGSLVVFRIFTLTRIAVHNPRAVVVHCLGAVAPGNGIFQSHQSRMVVAALPVKSSIGADETGRGRGVSRGRIMIIPPHEFPD